MPPEPCREPDPACGTLFPHRTFSTHSCTKLNQAPTEFELLAQAIQSLAKDKPDTCLPNFNGYTLEWLAFKRAYDESKGTYSLTQNHSRINKALRGSARDVAGALLATAHDPEEVMSVLELHFGRPELIVLQEVAAVRALPRVYSEGKDFHYFSSRVRSCVSVLKYLNNKSYLEFPELYSTLLLKLAPAIRARWKDFAKVWYSTVGATKLELLADFLSEEVATEFQFGVVMEASYTSTAQVSKKFDRVNIINSAVFTAKNSNKNSKVQPKNNSLCLYCQQEHTLENCNNFIQLDSMARWNWARDKKICHRCLKKGLHRYRFCKYNDNLCEVKDCKYKHHKLLHIFEADNICEPVCTTAEPTQSTSYNDIVAHATTRGSRTFLKIIAVTVSGPKGSYDTYALLDEGSSSTFIDREVAKKIGATGPKSQLQVKCVNGLSSSTEVEYVEFYIKGAEETTTFKIQHARSIPNLGISRQTVCSSDVEHLSLPFSSLLYESVEPKVIIGIDNLHLTIPKELRKGSKTQPVACLTALGWVVFGFSNSRTKVVDFINHISADSDIENIIIENYKLESLGILKQAKLSVLDVRAESILKETTRRLPDGQFEVGLLWKSDKLEIPNSYPLALSRFINLEKRFAKDKNYAEHYCSNVQAMIDKGYAERCGISTESSYVWYLPHFGVTNVNKPGKLRAVHDAAARCQCVSLNSLLLTGPDLLQSLLYIVLRFREGRIGMTADIREMFPQIKIRTQDRDAQRFLWRESPDLPISTFRMSSMMFGAAFSPLTALFIKNKNAEEHRGTHPSAVKAIIEDTYMDDYIGLLDSPERAAELAHDIVEVHSHAHFEIRGWMSNDLRALSLIPPNLKLMSVEEVELGHFPQSVRTLGIMWDPSKDELGFNVTTLNGSFALQESITKRQALSTMMKIFDLLGIIAPVTIRARIIFQVVWRRKIDWDVDLPQDLKSSWKSWLDDISKAIHLRIPRWHLSKPNPVEQELHVFCDASENAFAAVAYWRFLYADGDVQLSLICSKSRVAPLTPVTISRLELQAALIASRLASSVCEAHKHKPIKRYFWTDS